MGSWACICQSLISFFTSSRNTQSRYQDTPRSRTPRPRIEYPRTPKRQVTMFHSYTSSSNGKSTGQSYTNVYGAEKSGPGYPMGLASEVSARKRKRSIVQNPLPLDSDYPSTDLDLDGSTLVEDSNHAKRVKVSGKFDSYSNLESSPTSTLVLEGDTLTEWRSLSELSDDLIGLDSSSTDELTTDSDLSDTDSEDLSDTDESTWSISTDDSVSDQEGHPEKLLLPHIQVKRRSSSRNSNNVELLYQPPAEIIDKNLSNQIVSLDAYESDLSEDEIYSDRSAVKKSDKREVSFDFSMERAKRWAAAVKLPSGRWTDTEKDLFFRLAMRGFEPMVPSNWRLDFTTFPESLFAFPGSEPAYLAPTGRNEFRAIKFLNDLVSMGGRVRDRLFGRFRPEPLIQRSLQSYLRWTLQDADLHNQPYTAPPYAIYSLKKTQSTKRAVEIINTRLVKLANRYRAAWSLTHSVEIDPEEHIWYSDDTPQYENLTFPVITGFLICGPIVALITLDSDPRTNPVLDSNTCGRLISKFDFSEYGQDVWNALAIAIAAVRIRKTMIQCKEKCEEKTWMVDHRPRLMDEEDL